MMNILGIDEIDEIDLIGQRKFDLEMMRKQFKFRALRDDGVTLVDNWALTAGGRGFIGISFDQMPFNISLYSGMLDRDGKEIYEHDILLYRWEKSLVCWDIEAFHFYIYVYDGKYKKYLRLRDIDSDRLEVIGNRWSLKLI